MSTHQRDGIHVSAIVAVYNAEPYLARCIDSLIGQTLTPIEIILVDDGSTDGSAAICDAYASRDKRIVVIHKQNGGQTTARNAGLAVARGSYVHFVDSDDWLDHTMYEQLYTQATQDDADIITCDSVFHNGDTEIIARQHVPAGTYNKAEMIEHVYPNLIYSGRFFYFGIYAAMWNKLFKRELVRPNIVAVDPAVRIGEDGLTTFATFLDANRVCVVDTPLYHYRDDNTTSLTRSYCREQFDSALLLIDYLRQIAAKHIDTYDLTNQIDIYLLYNIRSIIIEEFYYRHKKPFRSRYAYIRRIVTHPAVIEACMRVDYSRGFTKEQVRFFALIQTGHVQLLTLEAIYQAMAMRTKRAIRQLLPGKALAIIRTFRRPAPARQPLT